MFISCCGCYSSDVIIDWVFGVMNEGNVVVDFDFDLIGDGSYVNLKVVVVLLGC